MSPQILVVVITFIKEVRLCNLLDKYIGLFL